MLVVHRSDRADALADALADLMSAPLDDPFAGEVVAVPTRGMERWLTQRVSSVLGAQAGAGDGVCANVEFPFPHRLIGDAVAGASGVDPDADPWRPERAAWSLLEVVDTHLHEDWLATLATYLGAGGPVPDPVRGARRLTIVRHLAGLFDRYALHRPGMVAAWHEGRDVDNAGAPLPAGARWQAELWRRLRAQIGLPGPAERRRRACERLIADPRLVALPRRLSLFGLTRLPTGQLEVLRALAHTRDVHLFLLHPSPALWSALATGGPDAGPAEAVDGQTSLFAEPAGVDGAIGSAATSPRRADDPTATRAAHPLLASWGRDAREMQLVLAANPHGDADLAHPSPGPPAPGLLGHLQADIRDDRPPPGPPVRDTPDGRVVLAADDTSVQIHACHGRARQVEVVRDAILHALAADETLEPRDVIVMCPDIETFAPLIQATFGAGEVAHDEGDADAAGGDASAPLAPDLAPVDLRVRLADRALRQTNPLLGVVGALLELSEGRVMASEVLDLADMGPVRRRFGLDDDDLTRLQAWVAAAGIRWGLDAVHRRPFTLEINEGTWATGLDRILLGVTMNEDRLRTFGGVLPLDDVDSRAIELAGRLAELIDRLGVALDALSRTQSLSDWAAAIGEAADALAAPDPRERWQRAELQRVLDDLITDAGPGRATELAPAEVRAYIADRLAGRATRANFRTGHLTVCTLMPMRSVPHRIVCLLGLDDGAFPRKTPRDGDDLMLVDPLVGERDPRSEDRQLLLDALMAAGERLIVTYTGNDERTNTPRPPAVPVGELLDAIDATAVGGDGPATAQVLVRHPLQPFDARNFEPGALTGPDPWSFDRVTLAGARALTRTREPAAPFLSAPLPARTGDVIELEDMVRFVEHPVRAFLRQRLGISLGSAAEEIDDALPVELDGLERWAVGQRLLDALRSGIDGNTAIKAEIARGGLPPGRLGLPIVHGVYPTVDAIAAQAADATAGRPATEPVDVRVRLSDGRLLTGTVAGVTDEVLLSATYSRVAAKHRIAAWVRLLAITASRPERPFRAVTVGRAQRGDDVRTARIDPLSDSASERAEIARSELEALVDLYDRGLREPLPLYCDTSAAYAEAAVAGRDPVAEAEKQWLTDWTFDREDRDPAHTYVLGGERTLAELLTEPPRDDEDGAGWVQEETTRLGRLARRLWDALLTREQVSAR